MKSSKSSLQNLAMKKELVKKLRRFLGKIWSGCPRPRSGGDYGKFNKFYGSSFE